MKLRGQAKKFANFNEIKGTGKEICKLKKNTNNHFYVVVEKHEVLHLLVRVFIALVYQHAKSMRRIWLSPVVFF
jgi:hypothetical protein